MRLKPQQYSKVDYSGGHSSLPDPASGVVIVADKKGLHLRQIREKFNIPWDAMTSVEIEGPEQAEKRVTATRMLATGLFAFALKKNESSAYMNVTCSDGEFGLLIPKKSAGELKVELGPYLRLVKPAQPVAKPPPSTPSLTPAPPGTAAGWRNDPTGRFAHRYWDGGKWSDHVATANGEQLVDPV